MPTCIARCNPSEEKASANPPTGLVKKVLKADKASFDAVFTTFATAADAASDSPQFTHFSALFSFFVPHFGQNIATPPKIFCFFQLFLSILSPSYHTKHGQQ